MNTKNKKYTVTLKDNKNLKINKIILSLKLKGKYYKATSKKGKVTFKIKLNKKGKYKGKILFKGNNLYKKISKTVQITIK